VDNEMIKVFTNEVFGNVRVIIDDEGNPWFVGKDVATALGYENPQKAIRMHVDDDDKMMGEQNSHPSQTIDMSVFFVIDNLGRKQYPVFINESGMYSLILGSKLPNAKDFKHWVTSIVLPQIRKTGQYSVALSPVELCLKISQAMVSMEHGQKALQMSVAKLQRDNEELLQKNDNIEKKFNAVSDVLVLGDKNWRQEINTLINRCVKINGISYQDLRAKTYHELEIVTNVRLNARLTNLKKRCASMGYSKTSINKLNKMDAIESDTKLKMAYIGIIKKVVSKIALSKQEDK
jgi:prophage antirepressor-like protein